MPAQIAHLLFAEDALTSALRETGSRILKSQGWLVRFGAQGPDFFYHNQRLRPTGLKFGTIVHREGYGRLVGNMVAQVLRRKPVPSEETHRREDIAYLLGFATHGFLDRATHPYITYLSGWVDPQRPETRRFFHCHAFLERILDVLLLKNRRGVEIAFFDFLSRIYGKDKLPYPVLKMLLKALHASYPQIRGKSRDRQRIENAFKETLFFFTITDPKRPFFRQIARARDQASGNRRRLALYHPAEIPTGIDFLNLNHNEWIHPWNGEVRSRTSFLEQYEEALDEAVPALKRIWETLTGDGDPQEVEVLIGNTSLDSGLDAQSAGPPRHCSPLPLPEIIDDLYRETSL